MLFVKYYMSLCNKRSIAAISFIQAFYYVTRISFEPKMGFIYLAVVIPFGFIFAAGCSIGLLLIINKLYSITYRYNISYKWVHAAAVTYLMTNWILFVVDPNNYTASHLFVFKCLTIFQELKSKTLSDQINKFLLDHVGNIRPENYSNNVLFTQQLFALNSTTIHTNPQPPIPTYLDQSLEHNGIIYYLCLIIFYVISYDLIINYVAMLQE